MIIFVICENTLCLCNIEDHKNVLIDKAFKCKAYHEQNIFLAIVEVYAYCKYTYFSAFTTIRFWLTILQARGTPLKFHVLNAGALYIIYCITLFIDCNKKHALKSSLRKDKLGLNSKLFYMD